MRAGGPPGASRAAEGTGELMPKLFYPFDAPAFWMRVGTTSMLAGLAVIVGLIALTANLELPHEIWSGLAIPPMLLLLIWEIALPLFVRQRLDDGLRLDAHGLARVIAGREESWSWAEVSDFRLHSGWHPMRLVIGRSITFRARRPARRSRLAALLNRIMFGGRNIAFGNNYVVVSEELADRLNRYRDMATGAASKPVQDGSVRTPEPALFSARDALDAGKRSKAVLILLGMTVASTAVMLGFVLWADDVLPSSLQEFLDNERIMAMLLPAFLLLTQGLSQHFWQSSPATNLILAGAGGLHRRNGLDRKHWRWDEIADVAVKAAPPAEKDRAPSESVVFTADHDGSKPGKPTADTDAGAPVTALDDIYDAPVRDIARQLETWAEWGQAHAGPVTPDAVVEAAARPPASAIRYQRQAGRHWGAFRTPAMLAFWMIQLADVAMLFFFILLARRSEVDPVLFFFVLAVLVLTMIGSFVVVFLAVGGSFNYLEVEPASLVYRRLGWRQRYGWHEVAPFELHSARLRWSSAQRSIVLFAAPRDDRISRYVRWAYRIGGVQPRVVIEDVYDIAASEILAVLEQHRRQGGRISRRPAA